MSYELLADDGETPVYTFHTDRVICDDDGCPCVLPSRAQRDAQRRADGRNQWSYFVAGHTFPGLLDEPTARERVARLTEAGLSPVLMRVTEDYSR